MKDTIKLNKLIKNLLYDNKFLLTCSISSLFTGYWFQDIVFSRNLSKIIADIPNFANNMQFSSILTLIVPYLLANLFFYIDDVIAAKTFPKMRSSLMNQILDKIIESIKTSKHSINVNELMLNLKSLVDIENIYVLSVVYFLPTIIIGCGLLYYFFNNDIKSGIMLIFLIVMFLFINVQLEKTCISKSREHEQSIDVLYNNLNDTINNWDSIIINNTKDKELKLIKDLTDVCNDKHTSSELTNSKITLGLSSVSMIFMFLIDGLAINLYYKKKISPDLLISICMFSYTFIQYYNSSIFKFKSVMHYFGRYTELVKYFNKFAIETPKTNLIDTQINHGTIVFNNVQIIHEKEKHPLKLNFIIEGKTKVGIVGEIGTGKTSILKILAGFKNTPVKS